MKLYSLNEHQAVNAALDAFIEDLKSRNPEITEDAIYHIVMTTFFSGHDGGVTESEIFTEFIESLDEDLKDIILKVGKVKSLQKKANKLKIKKAQLENQGEIQKDQVAKKMGRATDEKTKEAKKKAKQAITDKVNTQKEILGKKASELESRASEKAGGNKFLDAYKASLKHKGEMDALDVQLQQASEKEAIEIERAKKEKAAKIREEKAKAKAEAKAQQEKEKSKGDTDASKEQDIKDLNTNIETAQEAKAKYEKELADAEKAPYTDEDKKAAKIQSIKKKIEMEEEDIKELKQRVANLKK